MIPTQPNFMIKVAKQHAEDSIIRGTYDGTTGIGKYYDKNDNLVKKTCDKDNDGINEYSIFNYGFSFSKDKISECTYYDNEKKQTYVENFVNGVSVYDIEGYVGSILPID